MTVKELISQLGTLDPDVHVLCYTEDASLQLQGHLFRIFEIELVDSTQGERLRAGGIPTLRQGSGETLALLHVTAEF